MKILIIDDEDDIREILKYNLTKEGYQTFEATNGEEGLKKCLEIKPDLVLLDIMMPGMDGIEVCESIRKNPSLSHIFICFLTARGEDYSQIAGLDAGADDFVAKPVKPKVLISRINAILRRKSPESEEKRSGLVINRDRYHVELDGNIIQLPRKEFELLALLASKPGFVFERDVILNTVWGSEIVVGDRTIDVHVRKLREKIGSNYIVTIKGIGYKYEEKI
ncbi:MAG TPA: response regulator transcription factor [Taishania sp.]|nr:response regulator transcription factor [Taishania sp.]